MQRSLFDEKINIVPPKRARDRAAKPLFIWAGGKTKMFKHYTDILPSGDEIDTYIEPFFGGGAMLLDTIYYLKKYYNKELDKIVINDINPGLVNIYRTIKNDVDEFVRLMDIYSNQYLPLNYDSRKEYYFTLRTEHAFGYEKWTDTEEAAALYFLMKTGFNGIWQINKNTNGRFGTPNGLLNETTHVYEEHVVRYWHKILQKAEIHCGDWQMVCDQYNKERTFIFADPPYRDCFAKYEQDFNDDKQIQLLEYLRNTPDSCRTFLCNRDDGSDFFTSRLGNMNMKYIPTTYTMGRRKKTDSGYEAVKATEVLIYK